MPDLIDTGTFGLPTEIAWQNFPDAWEEADLSTTMANSLIISFVKVPLGHLRLLARGLCTDATSGPPGQGASWRSSSWAP